MVEAEMYRILYVLMLLLFIAGLFVNKQGFEFGLPEFEPSGSWLSTEASSSKPISSLPLLASEIGLLAL
ncbi:hypothetical protein AYI69_g8030 [Smittium culicis]|uniref:Uncharacterized protein n=1 Tax=Smittium culicis TaxID=133412 RepID=A0A1R1XMP9_9FUNG|nr:hypothetical protein AYI69_g8030 [Smittium culicis]